MSGPIFFGCIGRPGHFEHKIQNGHLVSAYRELPSGFRVEDRIDGGFAPMVGKNEAPEGQATVTHRNGYTCLAFWDRTGDKRGASNSAFVLPGELSFAEALETARSTFPMVFKRFAFEVTEFRP